MMTEWEKAQAGFLYDANYDSDLIDMRTKCADLCYEFNMCRPSDWCQNMNSTSQNENP